MEKIITRNIDKPKSNDISVYKANGGYQALEKALHSSPEAIIEEINKSGLVGRGGAAFPVGKKWSMVRYESATPKFLVCNADEG